MRSSKTIHVISCHAEGEVGDVIVGGVPPPCASHLSHPGCIKNADRSAGTGDGTIFAVRRA